ncbi:MAG TPA: hypothetical protein VN112_06475 [Ensifer sp.]|nr:hypothetical protein [Ensifer sp.]
MLEQHAFDSYATTNAGFRLSPTETRKSAFGAKTDFVARRGSMHIKADINRFHRVDSAFFRAVLSVIMHP